MKAMHHVGITVKDLEASIRFYHDVLGLEFSNEPSPWFDGEELGKAVGVPGGASAAGEPAARRHDVRAPRVQEPAERDRRGRSCRTASEPPTSPSTLTTSRRRRRSSRPRASRSSATSTVVDEGVLAGWRWVYFEDPDGYPLELVEVAYYNEDERRAGIAAYLASRA